MRHIGSLALAVVMAPLVWVLTGIGLAQYRTSLARLDDGPRPGLLLGLAALLIAGALLALMLVPRMSPVGPVLVGLIFLGATVWATVSFRSMVETLPRDVLGNDFALTAPAGGVAAVLAVPLLATAFSPRRWRRHDHRPAPAGQLASGQPGIPAQAGYAPQPGFAAQPGYPPPPGQPAYGPSGQPTAYQPTSVYIPPSPTSGAPIAPPLRPAGREPDTDATTRLSVPASAMSRPPAQLPTPRPEPDTARVLAAEPDTAPVHAAEPDTAPVMTAPTAGAPTPAAADSEATTLLKRPAPEPDTGTIAGRPAGPSFGDGEATISLRSAPVGPVPGQGPAGPQPTAGLEPSTEQIGARTGAVEEPTEQIDGATTRLGDLPPPPAAYPPPGHAVRTAPPVDPDATRHL